MTKVDQMSSRIDGSESEEVVIGHGKKKNKGRKANKKKGKKRR